MGHLSLNSYHHVKVHSTLERSTDVRLNMSDVNLFIYPSVIDIDINGPDKQIRHVEQRCACITTSTKKTFCHYILMAAT